MKNKIIIIICLFFLLICLFTCAYVLIEKKEYSKSLPNKKEEIILPTREIIKLKLEQEKYYIAKNLSRYLDYYEKHSEKNLTDIIKEVNVNIDYDFYTNVEESNILHNELVLVNKYYKLPESYVPELTNMNSNYSRAYTKKMNPEAYKHLKDMINDAKLDNIILYDVSSYRSFDTQKNLFNNYVKNDGLNNALRYSAKAGHSEHQTGLATDLNTASSSDYFELTEEYAWLSKNAYKYGFILRYPKDKEYLTGFKFEPWHYRYVGISTAKYIYENDLTFEEYYAFFVNN